MSDKKIPTVGEIKDQIEKSDEREFAAFLDLVIENMPICVGNNGFSKFTYKIDQRSVDRLIEFANKKIKPKGWVLTSPDGATFNLYTGESFEARKNPTYDPRETLQVNPWMRD